MERILPKVFGCYICGLIEKSYRILCSGMRFCYAPKLMCLFYCMASVLEPSNRVLNTNYAGKRGMEL